MRSLPRNATALVGTAVLALLVGSVYVALTASQGLPGQEYTYVRGAFTDVGTLRVGDDVRQASVRIGRVSAIELAGDRPVVTLQLDGDVDVHRNARMAIWARSALGQKFVELSPGTTRTGQLKPHEVLPVTRTVPPAELDQLLSVFDRPTRDAAASVLQEVGGGVAGHSRHLSELLTAAPDLLKNLGTVARSAASPAAGLKGMLRSANTLASRFVGRERRVTQLVSRLDSTLQAVDVRGGKPLDAALRRAPSTLRRTRAALVSLEEPLRHVDSAMTTLRPGARALADSTPGLRAVLREAVVPLRKVPGVGSDARPAVVDLTKVFADARPLAPRVADLLRSTRGLTATLAPYAPEISRFFTFFADALAHGDASGRYLRVGFLARPESAMGTTWKRDPVVHRNPYPEPGEAPHDRASSVEGN